MCAGQGRHVSWYWLYAVAGLLGEPAWPSEVEASRYKRRRLAGLGRMEFVYRSESSLNASSICEALLVRMESSGAWARLRLALASADSPAVMIFTNAAHYGLVHNFLCGLVHLKLDSALRHVVLWCADEASLSAAENDWKARGVLTVKLGVFDGDDVGQDAPFKEVPYARFAAIKAFMPWAAAELGVAALVQDADVVWRGDVISYLRSLRVSGAAMADSSRVDPTLRPCKPKESDRIRAYHIHHGASDAYSWACAAYRCIASVNGGFLWIRTPTNEPTTNIAAAARDWFARCPDIVAGRENQPSLVQALERRVSPGKCIYDGRHNASSPPSEQADFLVLNILTFASGQRPALAREADRQGRLLAFHCNFRFGWRAKCLTLRNMGLLFLGSPNTDICHLPPQPSCNISRVSSSGIRYCSGGPCATQTLPRWRAGNRSR